MRGPPPPPPRRRGSWARRFVVKTVFAWVASRANMLYLAARTHNRAAVCLNEAHSKALREFWTDWLPTETPFEPSVLPASVAASCVVQRHHLVLGDGSRTPSRLRLVRLGRCLDAVLCSPRCPWCFHDGVLCTGALTVRCDCPLTRARRAVQFNVRLIRPQAHRPAGMNALS